MSHAILPPVGPLLAGRGVASSAPRYSASNSGVPNAALIRMRCPSPRRTYQTAAPWRVTSRRRNGGRGRGMSPMLQYQRPAAIVGRLFLGGGDVDFDVAG